MGFSCGGGGDGADGGPQWRSQGAERLGVDLGLGLGFWSAMRMEEEADVEEEEDADVEEEEEERGRRRKRKWEQRGMKGLWKGSSENLTVESAIAVDCSKFQRFGVLERS